MMTWRKIMRLWYPLNKFPTIQNPHAPAMAEVNAGKEIEGGGDD